MFERDVRHRAGDRVDHARRVQSPAHPDLQHRHVDGLAAEEPEAERRHRLEERQRLPVGGAVDQKRLRGLDELGDGRARHRPPVDADAFGESVEVRRRVEADRQVGLAENGLHHRGRAPLPVRPRNLDELHVLVGVPEEREQVPYRLGPRVDLEPPEVEQEVRGLVVLHGFGNRVPAL